MGVVPARAYWAKFGSVSRAQRSTSHKRVYPRSALKCAQVGHARLAWIVTVRGGPGSAAHRSTSFRAAPHPGHLASLAPMRFAGTTAYELDGSVLRESASGSGRALEEPALISLPAKRCKLGPMAEGAAT